MARVKTGPYKFGYENSGYFLTSDDAFALAYLLNICEHTDSIDTSTKSQLTYWARELKSVLE